MPEIKNKLNQAFSISSYTKEQPGVPGRKNEDAVLTLENDKKIVGFVVDGGTALSTITSAPKETFDGYFAANTALEGVKLNFENSQSAKSLLLAANEQIGIRLKCLGVDPEKTDSEFLPTCGGASLILVDKEHDEIQIAQIGDTVVLIEFKNGSVEVAIRPSVNHEDILAYQLANKLKESNQISIIEALNSTEVANTLILGRHKENLPGGYGVLNGKGNAESFIQTKTYKISTILRIIALTDGMFTPTEKLGQELDWRKVVKDITNMGPELFYLEKVFKVKENDPGLTMFQRFKKHDDASFWGWTVSQHRGRF